MAFPRPYGRYILEDRLAMGGMAEIFRARTATAGFEKRVCIKRVLPHFLEDDDFVTMFRDEARTAARLQHANVVQVFDFGEVEEETGTTLFLAMELIEGADLRRLGEQSRKKKRPFTVGEVTQIGIDVCRGLHHAHQLKDESGASLGLVHRDISPHNILISRNGEVKITDFGIAKAAERATHTSTGIVKGKIAYMSPEQAEGKPFDHRLDQWALGVVLWELLCGERLFRGDNDATILRKVLNVEVPSPATLRGDVPADLNAIILRALAGTPAERFRDMREMEQALSRFMFSGAIDPATCEVGAAYARIMGGDEVPVPRRTAVIDAPQLAQHPAKAAAVAPLVQPQASPSAATVAPVDALATLEVAAVPAGGLSSTDELSQDDSQVFVSSGRNPVSPAGNDLHVGHSPLTQLVDDPADLLAAVASFDALRSAASSKNLAAPVGPPREPSRPSRRSPAAPVDTVVRDGDLLEAARGVNGDDDGTPATRTLVPVEHKTIAPPAVAHIAAPTPTPMQQSTSPRAMMAAGLIVALGAAGGLAIALGGEQPATTPTTTTTPTATPTTLTTTPPTPPTFEGPEAATAPIDSPRLAAQPPPAAPATPRTTSALKGTEAAPNPAEAPKAPGFVYVDVIDSWALVSIGTKAYGETPMKLTLPPGRYGITLTSGDGSKKKTVPVTVTSGGRVQVREPL